MAYVIIFICILLIGVILIQNSKGGGIQSQFGAATQIMGVKRGTEVVEKATWALAIVLIALSVMMAPKASTSGSGEDNTSKTKARAATAVSVAQPKAAPVAQPAQPGQP